MSLEAVECGSFTLDDAVLVLDSIFYCSSDHRVEFIFVMVCPGTGWNFGDQHNKQTTEELVNGKLH